MSVNQKMTTIANAIRSFTGQSDTLTLDTMASAIDDVYSAGIASSNAIWSDHVYFNDFVGSDETSIELSIPFKPNFVAIYSFDPKIMDSRTTVVMILLDFNSVGRLGGSAYKVNAVGSFIGSGFLTSSVHNNFTYEDGTLSCNMIDYCFSSALRYNFIAMKYESSPKQVATDKINSLSDSEGGSITFSQYAIENAFTTAEWNTLVATKPNWTIILV